MKRLTFLFIAIFCGAMFVNAQKVQTISDPNAVVTITQEQVETWGQQSQNDGDRGIIYLDFEGLLTDDPINDFYNGGTSGGGMSGGNYGVQFGQALGLIDSDDGGSGNFANEPSPFTVMYFLNVASAYMNVAAGFTTGFSFQYSTSYAATVSVYDGPNGTGNLLGTTNLPANHQDGGCTGDPTGDWCNWDVGSVAFSGTAYSVIFGGTENQIAYDDVTFGSTTPGPTEEIPISNWAIYFGIFLIGLFVIFRFRRRLA